MKDLQVYSNLQPLAESLDRDLRSYLSAKLSYQETAGDIVQETLLRLCRAERETPADNPRARAFSIAENLLIDHWRKTASRARFHDDGDVADIALTLPCGNTDVENSVMALQRLEQLHNALEELPLECKQVFVLHNIEGLSYSEITGRLGLSKSKIGRLMTQAIRHCSQYLDD